LFQSRRKTFGSTKLAVAEWSICDALFGGSLHFQWETSASAERSSLSKSQEHRMVDKDRVKGSAKQVGGKAKEWTGKLTGDTKTESEGKADQVKGKVQNTVGGLKDAVRGDDE
jgi:uncharacterized protein YjbJ (UPF0337 family)